MEKVKLWMTHTVIFCLHQEGKHVWLPLLRVLPQGVCNACSLSYNGVSQCCCLITHASLASCASFLNSPSRLNKFAGESNSTMEPLSRTKTLQSEQSSSFSQFHSPYNLIHYYHYTLTLYSTIL